MKIKSKGLLLFLQEANLLNGTKEEIAEAKKLYRKRYLEGWRQNHSNLQKEIRFSVSKRDFYLIKVRAQEQGLIPSAHAKIVVLNSLSETIFIPNRKIIEMSLQSVGIGLSLFQQKNKFGNISEWQVEEQLIRAEKLLKGYLSNP